MSVVWNCCYDCMTGWGPQTALSRAVLLSCYFFLPAGPWLQGAVPWKLWGRESFRGGKKQRSLFVCDLSRAVPPAPSQAMQNTWGLQGKTRCLILKQSTMLSRQMEKGRCYPIGIAPVLRCLGIIGQYHELQSCKPRNVTEFQSCYSEAYSFSLGQALLVNWAPDH